MSSGWAELAGLGWAGLGWFQLTNVTRNIRKSRLPSISVSAFLAHIASSQVPKEKYKKFRQNLTSMTN